MAERELDAGKPLFKKRTRIGRHAHRVTAYESLQSEEGSPQDKSVSVDELVNLRDMLRKPTGIELSCLNAGDNKRQRKVESTDQIQDNDEIHRGGAVSSPPNADLHLYV